MTEVSVSAGQMVLDIMASIAPAVMGICVASVLIKLMAKFIRGGY